MSGRYKKKRPMDNTAYVLSPFHHVCGKCSHFDRAIPFNFSEAVRKKLLKVFATVV
jgi:hypothetical protein